MVMYFRSIEALRKVLQEGYHDQKKLDEYDIINWDRIVKAVLTMFPECYLSTVMLMKMQKGSIDHMQQVMVDAFNAQLRATQEAAQAQVADGQAVVPISFVIPANVGRDGLEGCYTIDGKDQNPNFDAL